MAQSKAAAQSMVIKDRKCELCDVDDVTWKCLNCDEVICDSCKSIHLKSKGTRTHKFASLGDTGKRGQRSDQKCINHPSEDVLMYCSVCDLPVCRHCIASESHKNHSISIFEDAIDKKKKELSDIAQAFRQKIKQHEAASESNRCFQKDFDDELSMATEKVLYRKNEMKQEVDRITSEFVNQLQGKQKEKRKQTTVLQQRLQDDTKELRELVQKCESVQSEGIVQLNEHIADMKGKLDKWTPYDPPYKYHPPRLATDNIDMRELKALFGDLVRYQPRKQYRQQAIAVTDPVEKLKILNSFIIPTLITRIEATTSSYGTALAWCTYSKLLFNVTSDGKILKLQNAEIGLDVHDLATTLSGTLLILSGGQVKKLVCPSELRYIYEFENECFTRGITVTENGDIIVALVDSTSKGALAKITIQKGRSEMFSYAEHMYISRQLDNPYAVSTNINGDIVVVDDNSKVVVVDREGHHRFTYDGKRNGMKKVFNPRYTVTDTNGNIIISDGGNSVLHLLDIEGTFLRFLITDDGWFDEPSGLSLDTSGILWVCDRKRIIRLKYK